MKKKIVSLSILAFILSAHMAHAAVLTVNDSTGADLDNGHCSIVEAILNANTDSQFGSVDCVAGSGLDVIELANDVDLQNFFPNGFVTSTGTPFITKSLVINGAGHTISRNSVDEFNLFRTDSHISLTFKNIKLKDGHNYAGGLIYVTNANLSIYDSELSDSVSDGEGGVIYAYNTDIRIQNSLFENNQASTMGGVISTNSSGLDIFDSKFLNNVSLGDWGGAISIYKSGLDINRSTFDGNMGGTIFSHGGAGTNIISHVSIRNSTFSGNSNNSKASALTFEGTVHASIQNSTFSGNHSQDFSLISMFDDVDSVLDISYSTFANNESNIGYGVIRTTYAPTVVLVENSIFSGNSGGSECSFLNSLNTNLVNNLSDDLSCGNQSVNGFDANLTNNGGGTKTHKLNAGSNAIDTAVIDPALVLHACPDTDQRGVQRPYDGNGDGIAKCDIGSYESNKKVILPVPVKPEPVKPTVQKSEVRYSKL